MRRRGKERGREEEEKGGLERRGRGGNGRGEKKER